MTLTVATYNVHRCVGNDGQRDVARTLGVLRELDADVIALQELEWEAHAARSLLSLLANALGSEGVPGPTLLHRDGHYGNAVLTRLPLHSVRRIDLTVPGREPRGALDVTLDAFEDGLRVIATHLGLAPMERRRQMRQLLSLMPPEAVRRPVILLGDLNEWLLWGGPLRWLRARFGRSPAPATFPARHPVLALDRIWVTPERLRRSLAAHASPRSREASDHLPLRMTLASDLEA
jgi:endonuclease/exonuclease/phosphatase family metal-dependent hydrolase